MPATMLLLGKSGDVEGSVFTTTAMWSMYPLLRRDGLAIPAVTMTVLFNVVFGWNAIFGKSSPTRFFLRFGIRGLYAIMGLLVFAEDVVNITPAIKYPDIYAVLNSLISCVVFGLLYLRYSYLQFFENGFELDGKKKVQ
ncbi:Glucosyltransferase-like protein [Physocladia obscura]|uniref:Alpha-1,3-glucosyltransferase n=1 Tax=Physocladia obscura TaxID=109957 RepID=A0AAD5STB8_9FUNG|nr:Glucosyltransferase-like protein [Physocladia obscura]